MISLGRCSLRSWLQRAPTIPARRKLHLSPREIDHLQLAQAGALAQRRLARGVRLNHPECVALLTTVLMERIRDGYSIPALMTLGQRLLGHNQVMPGVADLVPEVQIEATFPDGTKLLTIHGPIAQADGDLAEALRGTFLPVPHAEMFASPPAGADADQGAGLACGGPLKYAPGATLPLEVPPGGGIEINAGRSLVEVTVTNTGDRPIQVGSHYHFMETNKALLFDRALAYGRRLNIPSGAAVRFEPGEYKAVTLVNIAGTRSVVSGNRITDGVASDEGLDAAMSRVEEGGFLHRPAPVPTPAGAGAGVGEGTSEAAGQSGEGVNVHGHAQAFVMSRDDYAATYGPTTGDRVVLGDTELMVRVERDHTVYGDECKFGGGKTLREGMGQATGVGADDALDLVITNALIVDAVQGVVKADIGIKDGRIVGIGKAGNPDVMDGVTPGMVVGVTTEACAGENLIATAGGLDTHVHWICPQLIDEAIASGVTTMFGGGTGPNTGTCATTCTPAPSQIEMMLKATDTYPINVGFSGKGNTSDPGAGLMEQCLAGVSGLKLHEDWGTTPSAIDAALTFADEHDIAITIHTDTLNESGFVDDSVGAFQGRTIHTYHTEGAGGGHAPDIIKVCGLPNVIPSSTNPTRPFTANTVDEHVDMLMVCHHLDKNLPEDVAFAESRIRQETIAAEDVLHDMGAISIMASDSQAMGRVGEVISRTWQTADKMKGSRGPLPGTADATNEDDNERVKRYIAKYTINPAIAHGMSHVVGSLEEGKLADIVLWHPAFFGAKPEKVIKGGTIAWAQMGDANASIPTPQPVLMRPMFGAEPKAVADNSIAFVSAAAVADGVRERYELGKQVEAVRRTRGIGKADMVRNDLLPNIAVDPETFEVTVDDELLTCEPANSVPLAQRYFLF